MPDPTNATGESLLWAFGLESVLSPDPVKLSAAKKREALMIKSKIRSHLKDFLVEEPFASSRPVRSDCNYKRAKDTIMRQVDEDVVRSNVASFGDPDLGNAMQMAAFVARDYLRSILPVRSREHALGRVEYHPSRFELAKFGWAWAAATAPDSVFTDLSRGVLTSIQTRAFAACYPTLRRASLGVLFDLLVKAKGQKKGLELPRRREAQLLVYLDKPAWSPDLVAELQAAYEGQEEEFKEPGGAGGKVDLGADRAVTDIQRVANRAALD